MRKVMLTVVVLALSGCAMIPSRALRTGEVIVPGRDEGYAAIIADVAAPNQMSAYLCQDGDLNRCLRIGPQSTTDGLRVYAMPPGNYCVTQVFLETGATDLDMQLPRQRYRCFVVEANTVSYPGHLEVRTEPTQFSVTRAGYRFVRVDGVREQVFAQHPTLAQFTWATPTAYPIDPPPDE